MVKRETRYDRHGKIVCMAQADGYRMVRRPKCAPFILTEKRWLALSPEPWAPDAIAAHDAIEQKKRADADKMVRFLRGY